MEMLDLPFALMAKHSTQPLESQALVGMLRHSGARVASTNWLWAHVGRHHLSQAEGGAESIEHNRNYTKQKHTEKKPAKHI